MFSKSYPAAANFEEAVKDALQVVLTSPQFLFLIENSGGPEPEPLDNSELASKLSCFLWNGPPDGALSRLATTGALRGQLDAEVGRMIDDPRFSLFMGEFTSQWLALDKFNLLEPDRSRFPKLTRDTRAQLRQEPVQFLQYLIRSNLSVRNLIESDFVMANEIVAAYYDLGDQTESGFQFVPLTHGRRELGGVLTQAAIMAGLSDGRESNPVKRGAWLARRIIAEPPDDPPPNVPVLKEDTRDLPLRQRLERHRNQPGCVRCHSKIDPWGGPLRRVRCGRAAEAAGRGRPIHPARQDGRGGCQRLETLSRARPYGSGGLQFPQAFGDLCDRPSLMYYENDFLRQNSSKLKADGYRMQDMVRFVVDSPLFLEK